MHASSIPDNLTDDGYRCRETAVQSTAVQFTVEVRSEVEVCWSLWRPRWVEIVETAACWSVGSASREGGGRRYAARRLLTAAAAAVTRLTRR